MSFLNRSLLQPLLLIVLVVAVLAACSKAENDNNVSASANQDKVIAKVNGVPVYESELNVVMQRFLGKVPEDVVDQEARDKLLDTLLRSKAMSMKMQATLTQAEKDMVNAQVNAFREDLLARKYVEQQAAKADISRDMIKAFYQDSPHLFGGGMRKTIEYVAVGAIDDRERKVALLSTLNDQKTAASWVEFSESLQGQGYQVKHYKREVDIATLESPLKEIVSGLKQEDGAKLVTEMGIYLVRVLDERQVPGKPLAEVSGDIQQMLARKAYREAVEKVSDDVMREVKIEKY